MIRSKIPVQSVSLTLTYTKTYLLKYAHSHTLSVLPVSKNLDLLSTVPSVAQKSSLKK